MKINTSKIAKLGMFLAIALIVSLVENMLPPLVPFLPYAKLGLSNIILLIILIVLGIPEGFLVLVLKCVLMSVFVGNFSALLWSLPAGLLAYSLMIFLKYLKVFSVTGMSIAGGIMHNTAQIFVASILIGPSVFMYLPYMMLTGGLAGLFTGLTCHFLLKSIDKSLIS